MSSISNPVIPQLQSSQPLVPCSIYQYRTSDHLYLVLQKEKQAVVLICNIAQKCLLQRNIFLSDLELSNSENIPLLLERAVSKKLIPQRYAIPQSQPIELMQQTIQKVQAQIPVKDPFLEEFFTCPGTQLILEKPVVQSCGHTVSQGMAGWKEGKQCVLRCPKHDSWLPAYPNLLVRQVIENLQSKTPIPTLAQFTEQDSELAEGNLSLARRYIQKGKHQEALDSYTRAFQFTKDLKAYAEVPELLEKVNEPQKAALAYLYLALYQLEDGKALEAMQTIKQCKRLKPDSAPIRMLWIKLALEAKYDCKAISMAIEESAKFLSAESDEDVIDFYKQLLNQDPTQWQLYTSLAGLLKEPAEKAHVFLMGACQAMKCHEKDIAVGFCEEAKSLSPNSRIDQRVYAELFQIGKGLSEGLDALAAQIEKSFQSFVVPKGAFGPEEWKTYFDIDVEDVPPLPPNIEETLNGDVLVLVPKGMSLNKLDKLVKAPKNGGHATKIASYFDTKMRAEHGNAAAASSYWVALRPTVFEGSRKKSFEEQQTVVATYNRQHGTDYQIPNALDAAVVNFVEYVRSGKYLYGCEPDTYTRCLEIEKDLHLAVGGFDSGGLNVIYYFDEEIIGVGGLRKIVGPLILEHLAL